MLPTFIIQSGSGHNELHRGHFISLRSGNDPLGGDRGLASKGFNITSVSRRKDLPSIQTVSFAPLTLSKA